MRVYESHYSQQVRRLFLYCLKRTAVDRGVSNGYRWLYGVWVGCGAEAARLPIGLQLLAAASALCRLHRAVRIMWAGLVALVCAHSRLTDRESVFGRHQYPDSIQMGWFYIHLNHLLLEDILLGYAAPINTHTHTHDTERLCVGIKVLLQPSNN